MRFPKIALAVVVSAASVFAQGAAKIKAEYLANFDDTAKKLVALAEKVPADKYSYKPGEGVRSIAQVFVHVSGANMMGASSFGTTPPADVKFTRDTEKTMTNKDEIVALLKKMMEHSRKAIETGLDTPEKDTKLFGRAMTNTGAALLLITHMHEHLGQSIAYARGAGVTPPWSEGR